MTKDELRKIYKGRRSEMDPETKRTADIAICSAIRALPEYMNATRILVYSPIRREIDLNYLFEYISEDGKKTMFPRCFGEKMRFADITPKELTAGSFGIFEPPLDHKYEDVYSETDVCIIPCLAANKNGCRLGYGGGFYDRFLKSFPGIKVVALYGDFITDEDFSEEHDVPAGIIVTDKEIFRI